MDLPSAVKKLSESHPFVRDLESRGLSAGTKMTISELADLFIEHKAGSGTVERSTLDGYRKQVKALKRDIGDIRVCELGIPDVSSWMASMTERGYAPRSVQRLFAVLEAMLAEAKRKEAEMKLSANNGGGSDHDFASS